jgi:hypothetical protein
MSLTYNEFSEKILIMINQEDGNCLFESMSNLVNENHTIIRQKIFNFYKTFDRTKKYDVDTIEYAIVLGLTFDNIDDEFTHEEFIGFDNVWASMTDVLVCSLLYNVDINIYKYDEVINKYIIDKVKYQYKNYRTLHILYSNNNHFEALIPIL